MPRGKPISPQDMQQACRLIAEGRTLGEIAAILGVSYAGIHRALTETWPDEYAEAKQRRNDVIRNEVWNLRADQDNATKRWAYDHLIKWHLPEAREQVDVNVGGQVRVTHERGLTLADVLADPRIARLGGVHRRELPAAKNVLADPVEDQPATGDLPPRPQ